MTHCGSFASSQSAAAVYPVSKVYVLPCQAQRLGFPEPRRRQQHPQGVQPVLAGAVDQRPHLCRGQDGSLPVGERRGFGEGCDVAGDEAVAECVRECAAKTRAVVTSSLRIELPGSGGKEGPNVRHGQLGQSTRTQSWNNPDSAVLL